MSLKMEQLLTPAAVKAQLRATDKHKVILELVDLMVTAYPDLDKETLERQILDREKLGSTGVGHGIAIPHCKAKGIDRLYACFGRSIKGVDFESIDEKPAHLFFALVAPENASGVHLEALAKISKLCQRTPFRESLMDADNSEEIYQRIIEAD